MNQPKKIILISLDTLRADHLGCYGNLKNTSPNIDRFSQDGVLFRYTFSPASHTIPAHGSLFTGKYPSHHTIGFNQNIFVETGRLNTDIDITLAEILQSRGYQTAAFVSGIVLSKKTNLNAGFEEYDDEIGEDPVGRRDCDKTNNRVFAWLDKNSQNDFFLFIHYFDIHGPYISPFEFQSLFNPDDYENCHTKLDEVSGDIPRFNSIPKYQVLEGEYDSNHTLVKYAKDVRHYISRYDSCIRYLDRAVGSLFDKLKHLGIYDDVLIIITSDHGEAFGENNIYFYHGLTVTRDQIHVPLIIKPDKNWNINAKIIDTPVSTVDIMPTILDLCSFPYDDLGLQGDSLKRILEGKHDTVLEERVLTSENECQYALIYPNQVMELIKKETPSSSFYPVIPELIDRLHGKKIYWDSGNEYLLSMPFDQYQRYKLISDIVNRFRKPNEIFTILEVGAGIEKNLKKFLPGDEIQYLDKQYPEESQKTHIITGDIIKTGLQKFYDFIITVDVYEHILPMERKFFIETLISHSTKATIIAAPFDNEEVKKCEEFANNIYKMGHGSDHIWLKEHISNGLPSLRYTINLIENNNLTFARIPNGYLPHWFEMISTYLLTDGNNYFAQMMSHLYEFYNIHYYSHDNKEPAYRQFLVISKNQLPNFSDLHSVKDEPEKIVDDDKLLKSFIEKIWRSYEFDRNLTPVIKEKDEKIMEYTNLINNFTLSLSEKDEKIMEYTNLINNFTLSLSEKDEKITEYTNLINTLTQSLSEKNVELNCLSEQFDALKGETISLKKSISYRLVTKFHNLLIEPFFPHHSKRRKIYDLGLKGCRITVNEGFGKTLAEYKKRREWKKQLSGLQAQDTKKDRHHETVSKTSEMEEYVDSFFNQSSEKSPDYVPLSEFQVSPSETDIKLIAFYLPQFHPIPENDRWWGKGFTEWTNVTKAVPQFAGHYQPRLPDELGFYNLTSPEIQKRQVELAKQYGLFGFCFHYYWFNGKRLLEKPLDIFVEHKEFDFPFCICWANENWTRRWDGMDHEILMAHEHSTANNIRFIEDLVPFLQDPRYIKIRGKPLIVIYRPMSLPNVKKMIHEWKEYCRQKGIDDLYVIAASTFGFNEDPKPYGMDALVEFPPHFMPGCPDITPKFTILNKKFSGQIWDFEQFVKSKKYLEKVPYTLFKGICPGWDNTARKPNNPSIFHGANPKLYGEWLSDLITWTLEPNKKDERFIFINAWNEWAEGAYLEPDRKFGFGYLEATRDALTKSKEESPDYSDSLSRINRISDDEWLKLLVDSVQKPIINGMKMPEFPPENIQKQFVGSSYEDAIKEGYNFFLLIKKYAAKYGISVDSTTKILDFGCGWGRITRILLKDFDPKNIYGVDVDPEIISICKDTIYGINFIPCNASPPLEFADNTFDIIYAYSVFSHLSEDYALQWIQEFSRILKPGGLLLATTQSGRFLDFCQSVRDKNLTGSWYDSLKISFIDVHQCRKEYEDGAFLFSPTGGGDYRDKTFYGEAIIPEKYIRRTYSKFLELVGFVDVESILPQVLFILQKKKMNSEENLVKSITCQDSCTTSDFVSPKDHIKKILIVSHDAHLWGAQMLALHIAKVLNENFHYEVHMLLKSGGRLEEDFKKFSIVYNLERDYSSRDSIEKLIASLNKNNVNIAICNTVVTGDIVEILVKNNFRTISLVHELPGVIQQYKQEKNAQKISKFADTIVFPAEYVKKNFSTVTSLDPAKCRIRPQGLFLKNMYKDRKEEARSLLREKLELPTDSKIVLGVGSADFRKGADLFVQVAKNVIKDNRDVVFVWVGQKDTNLMKNIDPDIENSGLSKKILFVGIRTDDLDVFYSGSDIFLLTSREDPFPSVVLDAMNAGVPVIGFQDAGGFKDIVTDKTGVLVPHSDIEKMSERTTFFLHNQDIRGKLGRNAAELIDKQFSFVDYISFLLEQLGHDYKKVSVIIPNYNYASYLDDRFKTIINQKYPIYEIIFLDDCSSDDSVEQIKRYVDSSQVPVKILVNDTNSGSVFRQWGKGISIARGDYIWIAEADDLSDERFLSEVMKGFLDPDVILSYSQSRQIDSEGKEIGPDYLKYTSEIDEEKWKKNYMRKGTSEICDSLVIKNSIPNVSATVFKKIDMTEVLNELIKFKNAGDWYFYVWLLEKGNIYFVSESLNIHRRHKKGVTQNEDPQSHFNEIVAVQDYIFSHHHVDETNVKKALRYRDYVKGYFSGQKEN